MVLRESIRTEVDGTPSGCHSIAGVGEHTQAGVGVRTGAAAELTEGRLSPALRPELDRHLPGRARQLLTEAHLRWPPRLRVSGAATQQVSSHTRGHPTGSVSLENPQPALTVTSYGVSETHHQH